MNSNKPSNLFYIMIYKYRLAHFQCIFIIIQQLWQWLAINIEKKKFGQNSTLNPIPNMLSFIDNPTANLPHLFKPHSPEINTSLNSLVYPIFPKILLSAAKCSSLQFTNTNKKLMELV